MISHKTRVPLIARPSQQFVLVNKEPHIGVSVMPKGYWVDTTSTKPNYLENQDNGADRRTPV